MIDKTYPIYRVKARWTEAYQPGNKRILPADVPLLPKGYFWNSTSWYQMEREERDPEVIKAELLRDWWPKYSAKRPDPTGLQIDVEPPFQEVWCPSWFSHFTYDVGLSDEEVLDSFERYVERIEAGDPVHIDGLLMGAEDRWRWRGTIDGDPKHGQNDSPCRCIACKRLGIVRIDH